MKYFVLIVPVPGWTMYTMVAQFPTRSEAEDWIINHDNLNDKYVIVREAIS